jgi:hypothetical protein
VEALIIYSTKTTTGVDTPLAQCVLKKKKKRELIQRDGEKEKKRGKKLRVKVIRVKERKKIKG